MWHWSPKTTTASAQPEVRDECLAVGMDEFIPKPIKPADLREAIERLTAVVAAT